jgi:hypothetical protein
MTIPLNAVSKKLLRNKNITKVKSVAQALVLFFINILKIRIFRFAIIDLEEV